MVWSFSEYKLEEKRTDLALIMFLLSIALLTFSSISCIAWIFLLGRLIAGFAHASRLSDLGSASVQNDVTIIVPMRNEIKNVDECISSILVQPAVSKIIIVDDNSSDGTAEAVGRYCEDRRVELVRAPKLVEGWSGKSNACYAGALRSNSEWLLFIDADTLLSSEMVSRALNHSIARGLDAVTCFGGLRCEGLWDRIAVPFYFGLLNSFIKFGGSNKKREDSYFIGSFILIKRNEYFRIGGHEAVAGELVEDKALSVIAHKLDLKFEMVYAPNLLSAEWAPGFKGGTQALSREMLPQMRRNPVGSAAFAVTLSFLFALPVVSLLLASSTAILFRNEFLSLGLLSLCLEFLITTCTGQVMQLKRSYLYSLFFILPEIIFLEVLWLGVFRVYRRHAISWRERVYEYESTIAPPLSKSIHLSNGMAQNSRIGWGY